MATSQKKVLVLTFGYAADKAKNAQINIANPNPSLTAAGIKAVVNRVVAAGALYKKGEAAAVNMVRSVNYVDTITEEITL